MRVLIVDDEWLIAYAIRRIMEAEGHEVIGVAKTGEAALEACQADHPDVVFMDVQMPGMDGITATRKLIETCPHPVIIVTGYAEYRGAAEEAGAMGFVLKPLKPAHVPSLISTALERFERFRIVHNGYQSGHEAVEAWVVVQRAIRALAEREGASEAEAFACLQRMAAAQGATLVAAAREVLLGERRCA